MVMPHVLVAFVPLVRVVAFADHVVRWKILGGEPVHKVTHPTKMNDNCIVLTGVL